MLSFAKKYGYNITSQNNENGIITEIIRRIYPNERKLYAVEVGAPDKTFCSNINPLPDPWHKTYYDIDPKEFGIIRMEVTPDNINDIGDCDLLSIDIDNNDYNVWEAYAYEPAVVIIEVNSSVPPPIEMKPSGAGSSYMSMLMLGISKGYFLVCHTGNMVFVLNAYRHLFPEIIGDGVWNFSEYFNNQFL
jgi:hypothetical protein